MSTRNILLVLCTTAVLIFSGFKKQQDCDPLTSQQLKTTLTDLGYTVSNIETNTSIPKYSITVTTGGLNIPIAAEVSASTRYIWLTVYLGKADETNGTKNFGLLKQNGSIQPCQFYVTKSGNIMMGLPVENRGVTSTILKDKIDFISARVGDTKSDWQ